MMSGQSPDGSALPWSRDAAAPRSNLPVPLTSFIGRQGEIAALARLIGGEEQPPADSASRVPPDDPRPRLVTLTGAGGSGKTRLALSVAAHVAPGYPDGVWLVELASLVDPTLVPRTVAATLGVHEAGSRPLVEVLKDNLRSKRLLLLLDNFEHLLVAAPLAVDLLGACPGLTILATSRAPLRLRGEREYLVPPLPVPDADHLLPIETLANVEAVRLFVTRARDVKPDFTLTDANGPTIAAICAHLDGLPLALELAATRIKLLSPAALLAKLDDRFTLLTGGPRDLPTRQQTLRGAITWSFDLLSEPDQAFFRRLAVFADGCTLAAAEAIACDVSEGAEAGGGGEGGMAEGAKDTLGNESRASAPSAPSAPPPPCASAPSALDLVSALVDASLLRQVEAGDGEPRFQMLETIREYGQERLAMSGEESDIHDRHAAYYLGLVKEAARHLWSHDEPVWLDRLELEHDNLRAALTWSRIQAIGPETVARLALPLSWFWYLHGHMREGRRWLEDVLALRRPAQVPLSATARARACVGAGFLAYGYGDNAGAAALLEEGRDLARAADDRLTLVRALMFLCFPQRDQGHYEQAMALVEKSLEVARAIDDRWGTAFSLYLMSTTAQELGDKERTASFAEACLPLFRVEGERLGLAYALNAVGEVLNEQGDHGQSIAVFEESLALSREVGNLRGIGFALNNLATVARRQGDHTRAAALAVESVTPWRRLGNPRGIAKGLETLGAIAADRGAAARAASLTGAAAALREAMGFPLSPTNLAAQNQDLAPARAALGEAAFGAAWEAGHAWTLDQALSEGRRLADDLAKGDQAALREASGLSFREQEVVRLIAEGYRDHEIAELLGISRRTVTSHVTSILNKLGVESRTAAATHAVRHGLL